MDWRGENACSGDSALMWGRAGDPDLRGLTLRLGDGGSDAKCVDRCSAVSSLGASSMMRGLLRFGHVVTARRSAA